MVQWEVGVPAVAAVQSADGEVPAVAADVASVNEEACLLVGEAAALAVAEGVGAEGVGAAAESKQ